MPKMLDWVKRLLATTHGRSTSDDDRLAPTPRLLALPPELLDHIVIFLDIPGAACLSLCSKGLRKRLAANRWQLLRPGHGYGHERKEFLLCLARDHPSLVFCYNCSRLHRGTRVGPALFSSYLPCIQYVAARDWPGQSFEVYGGLSSYRLTFLHVQLVMARHRDGIDRGIAIDSLSVTEVHGRERDNAWSLLSVDPKIIDNELFLRVQHWVIFDWDKQPVFERLRGPSICSHISKFKGKLGGSATVDLLNCQTQHIDKRASCPTCNVLYHCVDCAVEFESDAILVGGRTVAVIITKWLNLGSGNSPTDVDWRRHLYPPFDGRPVVMAKDSPSTKSIFEGQGGCSQETATRQNAALVRDECFRDKLYHIYSDVYRDRIQ